MAGTRRFVGRGMGGGRLVSKRDNKGRRETYGVNVAGGAWEAA